MTRQEGDALPVSTFAGMEDGTFPCGTSAYEKRGIAVQVPEWQKENCIQCNQCSYVCPHAAIRAYLVDEDEMKNAPESFDTLKALGRNLDHLQFNSESVLLTVRVAATAPMSALHFALVMKPIGLSLKRVALWDRTDRTEKNSRLRLPRQEVSSRHLCLSSAVLVPAGETPILKQLRNSLPIMIVPIPAQLHLGRFRKYSFGKCRRPQSCLGKPL